MDASVTTISPSTVGPNVNSPPVSTETASVQTTASTTQTGNTAPATTPKDTVDLSSQALNLSKSLVNQQKDGRQTTQKNEALKGASTAEQVIQKPTDKPVMPTKTYPPFMGNSDELRKLKAYSPALYRQVLKMIVPPPSNLSYGDMQILKGFTTTSKMA